MFATGREPGRRVEIFELHHATTGIGGTQDSRYSGDVVRRHGDSDGVLLIGCGEFNGADDVRQQIFVAQDGGLGFARGATGEQQHRHRVRILA